MSTRVYPGMTLRVTGEQLDRLTAMDLLVGGQWLLVGQGDYAYLLPVEVIDSAPLHVVDEVPPEPPEIRYPESVSVFTAESVVIDDDDAQLSAERSN